MGHSKLKTHIQKNKSFTYINSFRSDQFEQFSIPSISLSFSIPKNFSQTKTYNVYTDASDNTARMEKYPEFKSIYELSLEEKVIEGVTTTYRYSILIPKDPSIYSSDKEFLNTCSFDNSDGVYELCDGDKSFRRVNNQINYCQTYNQRLREIDTADAKIASSPQYFWMKLIKGNFSFENTRKTYIAKPLYGYDYCFVLSVYNHETRYTKPATIDAFADYTVKSLSR